MKEIRSSKERELPQPHGVIRHSWAKVANTRVAWD